MPLMQCVIYLTATAALTQRIAAGRTVTAVSLQCKQILSLYHNISKLKKIFMPLVGCFVGFI